MEKLLTPSELAEVYSQANISCARFSYNHGFNGFWAYARKLDLVEQFNEAINHYKNANTTKQQYKFGSRLCRIVEKVWNEIQSTPNSADVLWQIQFSDYLTKQRILWGL